MRSWFGFVCIGVIYFSVHAGEPSKAAGEFLWSLDTHRTHSGDFNGDGRTDLLLQPLVPGQSAGISFSFDEQVSSSVTWK